MYKEKKSLDSILALNDMPKSNSERNVSRLFSNQLFLQVIENKSLQQSDRCAIFWHRRLTWLTIEKICVD